MYGGPNFSVSTHDVMIHERHHIFSPKFRAPESISDAPSDSIAKSRALVVRRLQHPMPRLAAEATSSPCCRMPRLRLGCASLNDVASTALLSLFPSFDLSTGVAAGPADIARV